MVSSIPHKVNCTWYTVSVQVFLTSGFVTVQQECIPQALLGMDVVCQAKSGMGKTAVFVLACLQQVDYNLESLQALILCHTRELAQQVCNEFIYYVEDEISMVPALTD